MTECAKCHAALLPVSDTPQRRRDDWSMQFYDVLAMEFIGGYGMYFDPFMVPVQDRVALLCKACAIAFLDENEWARPIVDARRHPMTADAP